jgi:hypothetical protein
LLKLTKAKVWDRRVDGRSRFARRGRKMVERRIWGMKAREERGIDGEVDGEAEVR